MFRSLDKITEADSIFKSYVMVNTKTGKAHRMTIEDHYSAINEINLQSSVPEEIRHHFDTARNLYLYSWFVFEFMPVAERHAFASVEYALKMKSGKERLGLKRLVGIAVEQGWINDNGFKYHKRLTEKSANQFTDITEEIQQESKSPDSQNLKSFSQLLSETMHKIRNELAHGSNMSHPGGIFTIAICADIINQLFGGDKKTT